MKYPERLKHFAHSSWYEKLSLACNFLSKLKTAYIYRLAFRSIGTRTRIDKPCLITHPECISVGSDTLIRSGVRLEAVILDSTRLPVLRIGNHVNIEQNVHIVCSSEIVIEDYVTITGNCAIVDTRHPFHDVHDPVKIGSRIDPTPTPVHIGPGTFIGFGTVILPNVRIGCHCVIGANSTVIADVPDYSVAAGSPARIIRRYNQQTGLWQ